MVVIGTGKSRLLKAIINYFRELYKKSLSSVAVTASTGIAAYNIGGRTLHSWAGIGLGKEPEKVLIEKVNKTRWEETKVLIIDESLLVIIMDPSLFFD